jgi:hypothetical protein
MSSCAGCKKSLNETAEEFMGVENEACEMIVYTMAALNFRTACCERFGCPDDRFERLVFFRCVHTHAALPAALVYFVAPSAFAWDIDLIRSVATAKSLLEFELELNRYVQFLRPVGLLHGILRIRISGQKLMNLGREIFNQAH